MNEEIIEMDGCVIALRFVEKSDQSILKDILKIMLEQRIAPEKCSKFDD